MESRHDYPTRDEIDALIAKARQEHNAAMGELVVSLSDGIGDFATAIGRWVRGVVRLWKEDMS
ncbi:MAG: hypothetical protein ACM3X5_02915 [Bacillota bacterium]